MSTKMTRLELMSRPAGDPVDLSDFRRKSWPGIAAEHVRVDPVAYEYAFKASTNFIALLNVYRKDGEIFVDGQKPTTVKDLRNKLTFVPAGTLISGWSEPVKSASYTAVYFDQNGGDDVKLEAMAPAVAFEDHMLRSVLMGFSALLRDGSIDIDGYAETLGALLVYEINRLGRQWKLPAIHEGGLNPQQIQRVTDYIEGHLNDKLTVATLAELVTLSRFHFIRAFKKSMGIPPHQFIMRRRVDRAKEMLTESRFSVTEVAHGAGFNGLTQLTRVFRQVVGVTPTTFRRDIG